MSVDALWEKYRSWSPYHYSFNNPLTLKDPSGLGVPSDLSRFQPAWANDISSGFVGGVGVSGGVSGAQILGRLVNLVLDAVVLNALVEDGAEEAQEKVQEKAQEKVQEEVKTEVQSDSGDDGSEYYKPKTRDTQNRTPKKAGSQSKMGNNQRENKQFKDAVKELKLNKDQADILHDVIGGKDYNYQEILKLGGEMF